MTLIPLPGTSCNRVSKDRLQCIRIATRANIATQMTTWRLRNNAFHVAKNERRAILYCRYEIYLHDLYAVLCNFESIISEQLMYFIAFRYLNHSCIIVRTLDPEIMGKYLTTNNPKYNTRYF